MKYYEIQKGHELMIAHKFMTKNEIRFCVTGTLALQLIGALPPEYIVGDIDIIAFADSEDDVKRLRSIFNGLDLLSNGGFDRKLKQYDDPPYTFNINDVKVNVWVTSSQPEDNFIDIVIESDQYLVHTFRAAMHGKMILGRNKDFIFQSRLIRYITQIDDPNVFNYKGVKKFIK